MENNILLQSEKLNKSQRKFYKAPITKNIRLLASAGIERVKRMIIISEQIRGCVLEVMLAL